MAARRNQLGLIDLELCTGLAPFAFILVDLKILGSMGSVYVSVRLRSHQLLLF